MFSCFFKYKKCFIFYELFCLFQFWKFFLFGSDKKMVWSGFELAIKVTSHLTIFMRGMRGTGKTQRNNYQDGQCGQTFAGKTSSVSLIAQTHAQKIIE